MEASGNIYAYARERQMERYANRFDGDSGGLVLAIYTESPSEAARNALEKSFDAIGYDSDCCMFANLAGLEPQDVFELVEGIDPMVLVATDEEAALLYAHAVRQPFPLMSRTRVFGREARALPYLNKMLESDVDKQAVWQLLKSLAL